MNSNDPASERFELRLQVQAQDIDGMDHVNNVVYLRWINKAATAHWDAAATEAQKNTLAWVVVRHEIDYKYPARLGDEIIARTWVGAAFKNLFERHTELLRARDLKVLARGRSLWCPVDMRSGRPTRAPREIRERFSVPSPETPTSEV
jgi:acyl-CoA thioester hydrolase